MIVHEAQVLEASQITQKENNSLKAASPNYACAAHADDALKSSNHCQNMGQLVKYSLFWLTHWYK